MSKPAFSRAPGSQFQPTPPRSGLSSPSATFPSTNLDPFSTSSQSNQSLVSPSSSPVDFRTTFSGGAHSPALSPGTERSPIVQPQTTFGVLDNARPYPLVERRSFRDASSTGDVVVSREELLANGNNLGSSGAGAIGEQRRQSSVGPPGAIGQPRRTLTPSPSRDPTQEELALNLPAGILDSHFDPTGGPLNNSNNQVKSRPSSFILDVLPQSRERASGATTPSLSLESVSQAPSNSSTSEISFLHSPNNLAPHHASAFFQNPNSASSTTSLTSLGGGGGGGLNVFSNSRSSSPGPLDISSNHHHHNGSNFDSLSTKVYNLESTVSDLSTLLATEFKGLREEVNLLRSIVYQQHQSSHQIRRPPFDHRSSSQLDRETDSPLLTLRSPSPHHSPAFPQPIPLSRGPSYHGSTNGGGSNHSNSTLLAGSNSPNPPPLSPHSAPMNYFQPPPPPPPLGSQDRFNEPSSQHQGNAKDEQIKLLTQQVNSLTSTVSNLLSSSGHGLYGSNTGGGGTGNPVRQAGKGGGTGGGGPMSVGMSSRQMSLPVSMIGTGGGGGGSSVGSGLGVTTPGGSLVGGIGNGKPPGGGGLRSVSQGGLGRSASLRSASASQQGGGGGGSSLSGNGQGGLRMDQGVSVFSIPLSSRETVALFKLVQVQVSWFN